MSRTKLFMDVVEGMQDLTNCMRALAQALATDETLDPTPLKASPKQEVAPETVVGETPEHPETPEPVEEQVTEEIPQESPVKVITFEELRGAMATKSQNGKKAELKALLSKYGASKLSDISPEDYGKMMLAVEAL